MRMRFCSILVAVAMMVVTSPMVRALDIYLLSNDSPYGAATTQFGTVDSVTGNYTNIATLTGTVMNLAWSPAAGVFYATEDVGGITKLRTLTTTGTLSSSIGTVGVTMYGMAYRELDQTLYGWGYDNNATMKIDPATAAVTSLNTNTGIQVDGVLGGKYSIMNDQIYMAYADLTGGYFGSLGFTASSNVLMMATEGIFPYMSLANDGTTMYGLVGMGAVGKALFSGDPATGTYTEGPAIDGIGIGGYFHGAAIVSVPEPSTYAMGAIATGVITVLARRRKASLAS